LGINRFNNLRTLLVGPCGNFSYKLDCKAAIRLVKPPTTPTGSPAGSADCEINQRGRAYVVTAGSLEGPSIAGFKLGDPLLLRQAVSGGILMGKDHPHHRSIRPVVVAELIPRHHHRRLPGRFRHGCIRTRSRRNARSLRLSASIRRHSSAATPCSIRRRRQAGMGPPARCGGCRPPAPLALPRLSHPNIPRVAPVACPHDCLTTLWPAGADFRARETASLRGQLHGCSFNI
jgi:hypothetical protein